MIKKSLFKFLFIIFLIFLYPDISLSKVPTWEAQQNLYLQLRKQAQALGINYQQAEELYQESLLALEEGYGRVAQMLIEKAITTIKALIREGEGKAPFTPTFSIEPVPTKIIKLTPPPAPIVIKSTYTQTPMQKDIYVTQTPTPPMPAQTQTPPKPTQTPTPPMPAPLLTPIILTPTEVEGGPTTPPLRKEFKELSEQKFGFNFTEVALLPEMMPFLIAAGGQWVIVDGITYSPEVLPNFALLEQTVKLLKEKGIEVVITLEFQPPQKPQDLKQLTIFAKECASLFDGDGDYNNDGVEDGPAKPEILYWKIGREPQIKTFWSDPPASYAEVFRACAEGIKQANPLAKVIPGEITNKDFYITGKENAEFWEQLFKFTFSDGKILNDFADIYIINFYGATGTLMDNFLAEKTSLFSKYRIDKPIWLGEYGCPGGVTIIDSAGNSQLYSEVYQAKEIAKALLTIFSWGVERVFYYPMADLKQQQKDTDKDVVFVSREGGEQNFSIHDLLAYSGLYNFDYDPKLSFYTFQFLAQKLIGKVFDHNLLGLGDGVNCLVFLDESSSSPPIYFLWQEKEEKEKIIELNTGWEKAELINLVPNENGELISLTVNGEKGVMRFRLGKVPVILEFLP